jgi:hypothetical protein
MCNSVIKEKIYVRKPQVEMGELSDFPIEFSAGISLVLNDVKLKVAVTINISF